MGRFGDALIEHETALRIRRAAPDVPKRLVAHSLVQVGLARLQTGGIARAQAAYEEALALLKAPADRGLMADALGGLGGVAEARGDYDASLRFARKAGDLLLELHGSTRHLAVVNGINNIGNAHARRGDYHAARTMHEVALRIRRELSAGDHPDTATSLDNLAVVCIQLGDLASARKYAAECLAMRRRLFPSDHPDVARAMNNLGGVEEKRGQTAEARALRQQALAMWRAVYAGRPHVDVAICLDNLAVGHFRAGDATRAATFARQAVDEFQQLFGDAHPEYAAALGNRAYFLHRAGDLDEAITQFDRAIGALAVKPGKLPPADRLTANDLQPLPETVHLLHLRGMAAEERLSKQSDAAGWLDVARGYTLAVDVLERVRRDNLGTEGSRLDVGEDTYDLFVRLVGTLGRLYTLDGKSEHLEAAFAAAERATARLFLESLSRARATDLGGVSPELRRRQATLQARRAVHDRRRSQALNGPKGEPDAPQLLAEDRALRSEEDELSQRVEREHPAYAAWVRPRPCSLSEARACLGVNEAAVMYLPGAAASYAVVVQGRPVGEDPSNGLAVVSLAPAGQLAEQIAACTDREILERSEAARDRGSALFGLLLAPLRAQLAGKDLTIVAGGVLGSLPFELLVEGEQYVVETRRIRYAPSLTTLHLLRQWEGKRPRPDRALWVAADPVYSTADSWAGGTRLSPASTAALAEYEASHGADVTLKRLRGSGAETEAIRQQLGAAKDDVLTGLAATEAAVKTASRRGDLARCRYVHFATHGLLVSVAGRPPALVLSLMNNDGEPDEGGLNDGFLRLDEVTHLNLNADLVVLSACETGRGRRYAAEGVVGLARAFLYAGSRGVVCSLWGVDDAATAALMTDLYGGLGRGQAAADALRDAKLSLIRQGRPPFYWAAFIHIGA